MEHLNGLMEGNTLEVIWMVNNMDMEFFYGLMADNIRETGRKVSHMELEFLLIGKAGKWKGNGLMVKEFAGIKIKIITEYITLINYFYSF